MTTPPNARELWSLIRRLPREERLRLAKMAIRSAAQEGDDNAAYADAPVCGEECSCEDESLGADAERWGDERMVVGARYATDGNAVARIVSHDCP